MNYMLYVFLKCPIPPFLIPLFRSPEHDIVAHLRYVAPLDAEGADLALARSALEASGRRHQLDGGLGGALIYTYS